MCTPLCEFPHEGAPTAPWTALGEPQQDRRVRSDPQTAQRGGVAAADNLICRWRRLGLPAGGEGPDGSGTVRGYGDAELRWMEETQGSQGDTEETRSYRRDEETQKRRGDTEETRRHRRDEETQVRRGDAGEVRRQGDKGRQSGIRDEHPQDKGVAQA